MPIVWMDEGEVRTEVPLEKVHEAVLWRQATLATPLPLGLAALATATFVFGIGLAFRIPILSWVPVLFIFGGITLWTMAVLALRKGNTFAATFFGTLGSFHLAWSLYNVYGATFIPEGQVPGVAFILALLLFLTSFVLIYLWLCAYRVGMAHMLIILSLAVAYALAGIGLLTGGVVLAIAGWIAIASALISYYTSFALVWNSVAYREQVPLGSRLREEVPAHA